MGVVEYCFFACNHPVGGAGGIMLSAAHPSVHSCICASLVKRYHDWFAMEF